MKKLTIALILIVCLVCILVVPACILVVIFLHFWQIAVSFFL